MYFLEQRRVKIIRAIALLTLVLRAAPAFGNDEAPPPPAPAGAYAEAFNDPLAPFNEKMFWFNLKLDKDVLHPIASGYAKVVPEPARESVG